ncbi:MAG: hypothetical protein ACRC1P_09795 [Cellulosilyticaceae bacterium]
MLAEKFNIKKETIGVILSVMEVMGESIVNAVSIFSDQSNPKHFTYIQMVVDHLEENQTGENDFLVLSALEEYLAEQLG